MKNNILLMLFMLIGLSMNAQDKSKGIKLYKYNRFESAIKELKPLAAEDKIANYYLGLSQLGLEQTDKAKATFQKYADHSANMAGLARVMFAEGKKVEAMSMLELVAAKTKRKNKKPLIYAADAITYTEGGNVNKALGWYNTYKEYKNTPAVLIRMGDAYRKMQGGGGKAMSAYQNAAENGGDASLSNYKQGNLWYAAKNYDSALACYDRAAKADPENPLPYRDLADAYYRINKYDRAKTQIQEYLKRSDKTADDQIFYANTLYLSKDYDGAISKMTELLNSGLGKSYMYRVLGYSYFEKGMIPEAIKNMDLLFAKHPKNKILPLDYMTYGKILLKDSTRIADANGYFEKGIAADTSSDKAPIMRKLGDDFKDADDWANAAVWYEKVANSNSPTKEMLDYWWAGRSYYQVRDYPNAAKLFSLLIEANPEEPTGHLWLGNVQAAQDSKYKKGTAKESFKKYLSLIDTADPKKKRNVVKTNTYLALVAYYTKDYSNAKKYCSAIKAVDPANGTVKQILANLPK